MLLYAKIAPLFQCIVGTDQSMNDYLLQLVSGACTNSLYTPGFTQQTKNKPPEPLVERYYVCVLGPYEAAFKALGLSAGNTHVAFGIFAYCALGVLSVLLRWYYNYEDGVFAAETEPEEDEYGYNKTSANKSGGVSKSEMKAFVGEKIKAQQENIHGMVSLLLVESRRLQHMQELSCAKLRPLATMDTRSYAVDSDDDDLVEGGKSAASAKFGGTEVSRAEFADLATKLHAITMNVDKLQTNMAIVATTIEDATGVGVCNVKPNSDSVYSVVQSLIGELEGKRLLTGVVEPAVFCASILYFEFVYLYYIVLKRASEKAINNREEEEEAPAVPLSVNMNRSNSIEVGIELNPLQKNADA